MSNVTNIKGNLFNSPKDSIIVHACNTQGVWGSGIAKQFKERYPRVYMEYRKQCVELATNLLGSCLLLNAGDHVIGCLFTSSGFGKDVDSEESILYSTHCALSDLIEQNVNKREIHMCRINSGLFGIPWEKTLKELESFTDERFTVYEF